MTISVSAGSFIYIILGIILLVIILSMLLKKGDKNKKILGFIIIIVVFVFVIITFGRPKDIVINEQGITSNVYGKIAFNWSDVKSAEYIENYQDSPYKPVMKLSGTAFPGFRAGKFRLSSGENVKLVTQESTDAVIFNMKDETFLFAVDRLDELIDIADNYIEVVY